MGQQSLSSLTSASLHQVNQSYHPMQRLLDETPKEQYWNSETYHFKETGQE